MNFFGFKRLYTFCLVLLLLILTSISSNCFSESANNSRKISTRIINGTPVSRNSIPVVEINVRDDDGNFLCSGTMIAPNVVLTARHCVVSRASSHTVILKGRSYAVSKVRIHPLSRNTSSGPVYDAALLFLRRNPNSSYFPLLTSRTMRSGDTIYIYGYGIDDNGSTGRLYSGSMVVARTNSRWIISNFDGEGSNTCQGDSGGPAFALYTNSSGRQALGIVGVTSGGEREDCQAGDVSYFTNLQSSSTRSFLRGAIRGLVTR
jgi:V8-like Glu-specific endopeptidase